LVQALTGKNPTPPMAAGPRLPQDTTVSPKPPRLRETDRSIGPSPSQNAQLQADIDYLKQMGAESLTTSTVRRIVNVQREPVVTVRFRQPAGREILSCWGDSKILEDASVNGRYTLMCTASSGAQRQMEVVTSGEP
jgi:hypothetical protein